MECQVSLNFPDWSGSTIFPVSFLHTKIGSPLLKMIDLIATSFVRVAIPKIRFAALKVAIARSLKNRDGRTKT